MHLSPGALLEQRRHPTSGIHHVPPEIGGRPSHTAVVSYPGRTYMIGRPPRTQGVDHPRPGSLLGVPLARRCAAAFRPLPASVSSLPAVDTHGARACTPGNARTTKPLGTLPLMRASNTSSNRATPLMMRPHRRHRPFRTTPAPAFCLSILHRCRTFMFNSSWFILPLAEAGWNKLSEAQVSRGAHPHRCKLRPMGAARSP